LRLPAKLHMNIVVVSYHSTNYYSLDIKGGKLLVDCGWPGSMAQFTAELKRKGISISEIKYMLATHFHPDHAGLVEEFKRLGAQLILLESQTGAIGVPVEQQSSKMPAHITVSPSQNILLTFAESREFLASLGLAGEIIPTPGHSDDSVTLILDEGLAFTGDLPPRMILSDEDTVARASWDTIYRHKITHVYPAHGK
jgi:endoribonuclease LACTB2